MLTASRRYSAVVTVLQLRQIRLRPGEEYRDAVEVELAPLELGGQRYLSVPETVPADLVIDRTTNGTVFVLRFDARLHGPCFRCLEDSMLALPIHAREYQANDSDGDPELQTEYVTEDRLEVSAWARDAVALALPDKILCRPDCAGFCPVCGRNLNDDPHEHEEALLDPRWAALSELKDRLR